MEEAMEFDICEDVIILFRDAYTDILISSPS